MAYQPLYATIYDGIGERSTHSLRGEVTYIHFWLNSHFGEVMEVYARSDGKLTNKIQEKIWKCEERIQYFKEKGNTKKVREWEEKLQELKEEKKELEQKEFVDVVIVLNKNDKFRFKLKVGDKIIDLNKILIFEKLAQD